MISWREGVQRWAVYCKRGCFATKRGLRGRKSKLLKMQEEQDAEEQKLDDPDDYTDDEEESSCHLCFETQPPPDVHMTRCIHMYHADCLRASLRTSLGVTCPYGGKPLTDQEMRKFT